MLTSTSTAMFTSIPCVQADVTSLFREGMSCEAYYMYDEGSGRRVGIV